MTIALTRGLDAADGLIVRSLRPVRRLVQERFTVVFAPDDVDLFVRAHHDRAELQDVQAFLETPNVDGSVLYCRRLRSDDLVRTMAWAEQQEVQEWVIGSDIVDLRQVAPSESDSFWEAIAQLGGRASERKIDALIDRLKEWDTGRLAAFQARFELTVATLAECTAIGNTVDLGGYLAVVARGEDAYDRALSGDFSAVDRRERDDALGLARAVAKAWVRSTHRLMTVTDRVRVWESEWGRIDRTYRGPRDVASMAAVGLFPEITGVRFLGRAGGHLVDVVGAQIADSSLEDPSYLASLMGEAARRHGIEMLTDPLFHQTRTGSLHSGLPLFESRGPAEPVS